MFAGGCASGRFGCADLPHNTTNHLIKMEKRRR
jgi:hypothetical protein